MIGLGYTVPALLSVGAVVLWERAFLHTGLFAKPTYWVSVAVVLAFQVPVDGWLTKLDAPIVVYNPAHLSGIRFPWDIPVEDFLFGFSLATAALLSWERQRAQPQKRTARTPGLDADAVPAAFDGAAASYDALVTANPGYHRDLRVSVRRMRLPDGGAGLRILDAGCGTGASTAALLTTAPHAHIVAVDASEEMLHRARAKSWPQSVQFVHSRIEDLLSASEYGPFDAVFAAYLVRNLRRPDEQLRTFRQILRPGGKLAVHEYSIRDSIRARAVWNAVCWTVIIPAGTLASGDSALYRYLWRSVRSFDGVQRFQRRLRDCGFTDVQAQTVPGWQRHVVHTFLATAPSGRSTAHA